MRRILIAAVAAAVAAQGDDALLKRADVAKARAYLQANHDRHIEKQITISESPAPTFEEKERGEYMAGEFRRLGLTDIETDARGNVLGWRRGRSPRTLVIAAHLDTVHPRGVDVK